MCPSSTFSSEAGWSADGLIKLPEPRRQASSLRGVVLAVFAFALLGTLVVDLLFPAEVPTLIGREKVEWDRLNAEARFADGSLALRFETNRRLRSRTREILSSPYALALYLFLGEVKPIAVVGAEKWLFLRERMEPSAFALERGSGFLGAFLAALDRRMAALGVQLVLAPIPRKAVACARYLPEGADSHPEFDEGFAAAARERGVTVADVPRAFREHEGPDELYALADSHWTELGQRIAAQRIARDAGLASRGRETRLQDTGRRPESVSLLGVLGINTTPRFLRERTMPTFQVRERGGKRVTMENPDRMSRIALCGTSFSAQRKLAYLLGHFAGEPVWNAARPGVHPLQSLADLMSKLEGSYPEVCILEFPIHFAFDATLPPGAVSVLARPVPVHELFPAENPGEAAGGDGRRVVARVAASKLYHTGDGIVSLRLRAAPSARARELLACIGAETLTVQWPAGAPEILLPCIASQTPPADLYVVSTSGDELDLLSADIVTELDLDRCAELRPASDGDGGDGTDGDLLPFGERLPPRAGILLQIASAVGEGSELEASIDGAPRRWLLPALEPGAWIAVNLNPARGSILESVKLRAIPGSVAPGAIGRCCMAPGVDGRKRAR